MFWMKKKERLVCTTGAGNNQWNFALHSTEEGFTAKRQNSKLNLCSSIA
jgi:hypothetical protein